MRPALFILIAVAVAGCVSVESLPNPSGALKPGQRLVVAVYPAPGPWIVDAPDSKAESAAKISPLGFLMQDAQNKRILSVSKNLQQYLPRPHLHLLVSNALLEALKTTLPSSRVQTAIEAGIPPAQLSGWNKAEDQLDWRLRYYAPDPSRPAPRDYARLLTLDDAVILDVNVSFGTAATDDGLLAPQMSAASRAYRGDTTRLLWEHEDAVVDRTSTGTLTDMQMQPVDLTNRLERLAPALGAAAAASFAKAFDLSSAAAEVAPSSAAASGLSGGLVPMSYFQNASPSTATAVSPPTSSPPDVSTTTNFVK